MFKTWNVNLCKTRVFLNMSLFSQMLRNSLVIPSFLWLLEFPAYYWFLDVLLSLIIIKRCNLAVLGTHALLFTHICFFVIRYTAATIIITTTETAITADNSNRSATRMIEPDDYFIKTSNQIDQKCKMLQKHQRKMG